MNVATIPAYLMRIENKRALGDELNLSESTLLDIPLNEFEFSARVNHVLEITNLHTIGDVCRYGLNNLLRRKNFGLKSFYEVIRMVDRSYRLIRDTHLTEAKQNDLNKPESNTKTDTEQMTFINDIALDVNNNRLKTSLDEFLFSVRVSNALSRHKLYAVGDVLSFGIENVRRKSLNVGKKSLKELRNKIDNYMSTGLLTEKNGGTVSMKKEKQGGLDVDLTIEENDDKVSITEVIDNLLSLSLTDKQQQTIKARYGYENGKKKTLEQIGNEVGITRERVRQIIVNAHKQLKHPSRRKYLQEILERVESVLLYNQGVINVNDLLTNDFFSTANKHQLKFLLNLLVALYEDRYRIIDKNFLTYLTDDELKSLHSTIRNAAIECQFPTNKETFFQTVIAATGHVSHDYLSYFLLHKDRAEILRKVISSGRLSLPKKIKFIMRNVDEPLHFTKIVELYKSHFGDSSKQAFGLEHAIHARIGDSEDFIIVGRGTFMVRDKFKVPDNIEDIVNASKEILKNLQGISDTKYILKELRRKGINVGNLNEYSLKPILLEYPEFVRYRKFEIGIKKITTGYERKPLTSLVYGVLIRATTPLHSKEIWKQITIQRGFPRYAVEQILCDKTQFIRLSRATYTVKENIPSYEMNYGAIVNFAKEWINLKGHAVSAFFVNEVIKETEEIKDLNIGLVEHVLATSSEFQKVSNGFYDLANK